MGEALPANDRVVDLVIFILHFVVPENRRE